MKVGFSPSIRAMCLFSAIILFNGCGKKEDKDDPEKQKSEDMSAELSNVRTQSTGTWAGECKEDYDTESGSYMWDQFRLTLSKDGAIRNEMYSFE